MLLMWISTVTHSGLRDLQKEAISDYHGQISVDAVSCLLTRTTTHMF